MVKNPPVNAADAGDAGLIPGSGRSPGEGNGNPLQYPCLENPWTEEPGGLQSVVMKRARQELAAEHVCAQDARTHRDELNAALVSRRCKCS